MVNNRTWAIGLICAAGLWLAAGAVSERTVAPWEDPAIGPETRFEYGEATEYHRFLPEPPEMAHYQTRSVRTGDPFRSTGKAHELVLITLEQGSAVEVTRIARAYLLVCSSVDQELAKERLFLLYDEDSLPEYAESDVFRVLPEYVDFGSVPERVKAWRTWPRDKPIHVMLRYVDFTGDGVSELLLVVRESANRPVHLVRVLQHEDGALRPLLTAFYATGDLGPEVRDLDGDGRGELALPRSVYAAFVRVDWPSDWISTYEWDGERLALDNRATYDEDTARQEHNLEMYGALSDRFQELYLEAYEFQIGMIYYYKDDLEQARQYLERVVAQGEDEHYVATAKAVLAEMDANESKSHPRSR